MKKIRIYFLFSVVLILLNSCDRWFYSNKVFSGDKNMQFSQPNMKEKEYKVAKFDNVALQVFTNDGFKMIDLSATSGGTGATQSNQGMSFDVEGDGTIKIPIIGRLKIDSLTIRQLETLLEDKFSKYYQNPYVKARVTNRKVSVWRGSTSVMVSMSSDNFTLLDAIIYSGGIPEDGKSYDIRVIRGDISAKYQVFQLNIESLTGPQNKNMPLEANDAVYIDVKRRYVSRFLRELQPYLTIVATFISVKLLYDSFSK